MKYLLILMLLVGCGNNRVQPPIVIAPPSIIVSSLPIECEQLEPSRYSQQFSELVCALKESKQNPELKSIVLAQWILESGRGNSKLAMKFLNFGGLKWRKEMTLYGNQISYEAWDGRTSYIQFSSVDTFIRGYWHFIARYPYRGWDAFKSDPHGYIKFINHAGYTPPREYYKKVIELEGEAKELLKGATK